MNNRDRAERALKALIAYSDTEQNMSNNPELLEEVASDLLADLSHLFDRNGVEWAAVARRAELHYREEVREEG